MAIQKRVEVASLISDKIDFNQKLPSETKSLYNNKEVNSSRAYNNCNNIYPIIEHLNI